MRWTRDFDYSTGLDIKRPNTGTTPGTRDASDRFDRCLEEGRVAAGNREFELMHGLPRGTTRVPTGSVLGPWRT